jgi:hypothetical protein
MCAVGDGGGACQPQFASGLNVAWVSFAMDVPSPDLATFRTVFQNTFAAGGRVVRWWFHVDGRSTPGYYCDGTAQPISCSDIADVKSILDTAAAAGVAVTISLWSFDMLRGTLDPTLLANNVALLTNDQNRQDYIDRVLTPLVTALRGHPGLHAWEVFNEPEGMTKQYGYTQPAPGATDGGDGGDGGAAATTRVDESVIQRTVNWFADAIHAADPGAKVTNGTWTFQANSDVAGNGSVNYYSDAALVQAGGRANGTLDFYEVHYYVGNGAGNSPFINPYTHWQLDKPVVIGEFHALDQGSVHAADTYRALFDGGYAGAWAWQYLQNDSQSDAMTKWPTMQVPMEALYDAEAPALDCP